MRLRTFLDNQQYFDPDGIADALGISPATWPLAGLLWESSTILAELMLKFDVKGKRILEVGCGIALSSLVLKSRGADVTATDLHPEVQPNLIFNSELNQGEAIPYFQADWKNQKGSEGLFDLIIASDVLYQPAHPELLASFILQHAHNGTQIIVVDPGRGNLAKFGKALAHLGFVRTDPSIGSGIVASKDYQGRIHTFVSVGSVD